MRRVSLRPRGKRAARWEKWQQEQRMLVISRARNRCEQCGRRGEHWHHCFGRKNIIAEPLASHAAMTTWLCQDCHYRVHRLDVEWAFVERVRWQAIQRAVLQWMVPLIGFDNPVDAAREIERQVIEKLKEEALEP